MADVESDPGTAAEWADYLRFHWERRSRHESRDLFVSSNPGWRDPEAWNRYARTELELFLVDLAPERLAGMHALEIGCGSGRLVPHLRPQVRSYSGFDIAPGMVEAATARASGLSDVRLSVGDGLGVPAGFHDRRYGLILCVAVFIHCPKQVIESYIRSAWALRDPDGGEMRFQVLANPHDATGIERAAPPAEGDAQRSGEAEPAAPTLEVEVSQVLAERTAEEKSLASDAHYMGHAFLYDEVREMAQHCAPDAEVLLYRGDLGSIYARLR